MTLGHVREREAIEYFENQLNIVIDSCGFGTYELADGIILTGTPDGRIRNFSKSRDAYVEIKHVNDRIIDKHIFQVYGYYLIFKETVLLMVGDLNPGEGQRYNIYKYTPDVVEMNWEPYEEIVVANAKRLKKLLTPLCFDKYIHLRDKINIEVKKTHNGYKDNRKFINF
jgi:hypothetical protein